MAQRGNHHVCPEGARDNCNPISLTFAKRLRERPGTPAGAAKPKPFWLRLADPPRMTLAARFAAQLAQPRGLAGGALGRAMDFANSRPMRLAVQALSPRRGERVLDAGCGTGAALRAIRERADCMLHGLDRSAEMIAVARRRLGPGAVLAEGEIERIPKEWPPFDAVLALNVLYFAGRDGAMAAGLRSALRPGGRLVAYVSHRQTMERWAFARTGHHRLFDAQELEGLLLQGGFAPASILIEDHAVAPGVRGLIAHAEA